MCGIFCKISKNNENVQDIADPLVESVIKDNLVNRGPDYFETKLCPGTCYNCFMAASILWLHGSSLVPQPSESTTSILLYNGDIYDGLEFNGNKNDTILLHNLLDHSLDIVNSLMKLKGPFSFIYFHKIRKKIYFCRDIFGRRSLLLGKKDDSLIITSVSSRNTGYTFIEIPPIGVYCIDLVNGRVTIDPYKNKFLKILDKINEVKSLIQKDILINERFEMPKLKIYKAPNQENLKIFSKLQNSSVDMVFNTLFLNNKWRMNIDILENVLKKSVEKRILRQPKYCKSCIEHCSPCNHARTGILFSGGLDSAVLAILLDKFEDHDRPIDLFNVAFNEENNFETPDRLSGRETLHELNQLCPNRKWNFIEVNISKKLLNDKRESHIADLIYPLNTILDDSLGCALWFASQATFDGYQSPCRVIFVGMGADELFGGYTHHKAAFKNGSWAELSQSMDTDWNNISFRNLSRDDRVVSDSGRQLRTPYLDEDVVNFVLSLECWEKTYPTLDVPNDIGSKILLRSLCYHLGLKNAAVLKKRALQFGSRIANRKEKAHQISARLC